MRQTTGALLAAACSASCLAQPCQVGWRVDPVGNPGTSAVVRSMIVFNDGSGPALYVGGPFFTAGGITVNSIAKWNGSAWSALGSGMTGPTASAAAVNGLGVFNDGSGEALYAAGNLITAGGQPALRIAKWNGSTWSALGSGLDQAAQAMAVFNDGTGPAFYVGGSFTLAGGVPGTSRIAKWNGSAWSAVGGGMDAGSCNVLYVYNDGTGNALYAGGTFSAAGGLPETALLARWNGTQWSSVGGGLAGGGVPRVNALMAFDDGQGPALYVGGLFDNAGTQPATNFAKWKNGQWSQAGGGTDNTIIRMAVFNDGGGPALYVGGSFSAVNLLNPLFANQVAKWNGETWQDMAGGLTHPVISTGSALAVFNDGGGEALFVAGGFLTAGGQATNNIARWGCTGPAPGGCYPNCDGSTTAPILNVQDFICFINRFNAGLSEANCDASTTPPVLNVQDFGCFLNAFNAGCS